MADEYQVLGWLFTARDEASPVLESGQEAIERAAGRIDDTLDDLVDQVDEATVSMSDRLGAWADTALDILLKPLDIIESAVVGIAKGLVSLPVGVVKGLGNAIQNLGQTASSAAVRVGEIVQNFISLDTLKKGLVASGGLFGALLGPFGSLLRLFQPLIDVLVEGLTPAMDTFAAIFKTSFNELFELAEVLAQMFAPLLQEFMEPFVSLMEVLAVQAAAWLTGLLKSDKAASGIASLFQSLGPVVMDIFRALGGLGREILPIVVDVFNDLAPIAVDIVKDIGKLAAELLPEFGRIAKEVIPPLAKAFTGVLKSIVPLIKPLGKLAKVLIEKVFGPAVIKGTKVLADWLTDSVIPFIEEWMPALVILIEDVADQVSDFYSNFTKNIKAFYIAILKPSFVDPISKAWKSFKEWLTDGLIEIIKFKDKVKKFGKEVLDALGLGDISARSRSVMAAFIAPLQGALDTIKDTINDYVIDAANDILAWDPPGPGGKLSNIVGLGANYQIPKLAEGAIIEPSIGGTPVIVGEGGRPETVIPLTAEKIREVVGPINFQLEGAKDVIGLVRDIRDALTRPLRIADEGGRPSGRPGDDEVSELGANIVGFSGVIG